MAGLAASAGRTSITKQKERKGKGKGKEREWKGKGREGKGRKDVNSLGEKQGERVRENYPEGAV